MNMKYRHCQLLFQYTRSLSPPGSPASRHGEIHASAGHLNAACASAGLAAVAVRPSPKAIAAIPKMDLPALTVFTFSPPFDDPKCEHIKDQPGGRRRFE